jgi:cytoskeletal protein CcmA (bactofilin family)
MDEIRRGAEPEKDFSKHKLWLRRTPPVPTRIGGPKLSFFGNSNRPDLKVNSDLGDRGVSDARYLGEVSAPEDDIATPAFASDRMQQSNSAPTPPERCTNIVATGAKWKGTLKVDDSVRIDGTFSGEVDTKGTVHVSEGADVDAKIHATFVIISGNFKGEIRCDQRAELMPRGKVTGEISTKTLSIHEGATLDGSVQMTETGSTRVSGSRSTRSNGSRASHATNGSTAAAEEETPSELRNGHAAEAVSAE